MRADRDPLLLEHVNAVDIMNRAWAVKNRSLLPQDYKTAEENFRAVAEASRASFATLRTVFSSTDMESSCLIWRWIAFH